MPGGRVGALSVHRPVVEGSMRLVLRLGLICAALAALPGCDPGPNGYGTAPPGVSQEQFDAEVRARRQAKQSFFNGPRGGASGR